MPEGKLANALSDLLATAEQLNTTSNSINTILNAVEHELVKANIGLEVWLTEPGYALSTSRVQRIEGTQNRIHTTIQLGFTKLQDSWHLAARDLCIEEENAETYRGREVVSEDLERDPYPLAQTSRHVRIQALRCLPILLQQLHEEAREAIHAIENAKQLVIC